MRMASLKFRLARCLKIRPISEALILAYHRVAALPLDPQLLSVTAEHFAEHLEVLHRYYRPTRLRQLAQTPESGVSSSRAVVITFDDGYADNLYNAKPLLERYDVPATVFVSTGYVGGKREFWWDELERLLLQPGTLPETLSLSVNRKRSEWTLGEGAFFAVSESERHRDWNVELKRDPSSRHTLYRTLCRLLRPLPEAERQQVLDALFAWAGAETRVRPTHRALSSKEVVQLAKEGLVEVGSHSVTHPVFSALATALQRSEIVQSKAYLEEILDHPVTSFAYPYGSKSDYTQVTVALLQEAKYNCACANFAEQVRPGYDSFQLPRVLVRDCDGEVFGRLLRRWFHA